MDVHITYAKNLFRYNALSSKAGMVELVDTLDLGSSVVRRESSSLSFRTILIIYYILNKKFNHILTIHRGKLYRFA